LSVSCDFFRPRTLPPRRNRLGVEPGATCGSQSMTLSPSGRLCPSKRPCHSSNGSRSRTTAGFFSDARTPDNATSCLPVACEGTGQRRRPVPLCAKPRSLKAVAGIDVTRNTQQPASRDHLRTHVDALRTPGLTARVTSNTRHTSWRRRLCRQPSRPRRNTSTSPGCLMATTSMRTSSNSRRRRHYAEKCSDMNTFPPTIRMVGIGAATIPTFRRREPLV